MFIIVIFFMFKKFIIIVIFNVFNLTVEKTNLKTIQKKIIILFL